MSTPLPEPHPGLLAVGGYNQARRHHKKFDAVLTCEDPSTRDRLRVKGGTQLVLAFEDCDDITLGYRVATLEDMKLALEFERAHRTGAVLVHCFHGVGRSAAVALMAHADRLGRGKEQEAVGALMVQRPEATPNLIAVDLADQLLGREGALSAALRAYETLHPAKLLARRRRLAFARENPGLFAKLEISQPSPKNGKQSHQSRLFAV